MAGGPPVRGVRGAVPTALVGGYPLWMRVLSDAKYIFLSKR